MKQSLPELVLASTSPFRKELLQRFHLPFIAKAPGVDEEALKTRWYNPLELAQNLALLKSQSLATEHNIVIGGDQLVALDGEILGKPHTRERAITQLQKMRGKTHELITAVAVCGSGHQIPLLNITRLQMRNLSNEEIERYVQLDQPLNSAGAYKIEGIGIALFDKIETSDFTSIIGLPLMELAQILRKIGYQIP